MTRNSRGSPRRGLGNPTANAGAQIGPPQKNVAEIPKNFFAMCGRELRQRYGSKASICARRARTWAVRVEDALPLRAGDWLPGRRSAWVPVPAVTEQRQMRTSNIQRRTSNVELAILAGRPTPTARAAHGNQGVWGYLVVYQLFPRFMQLLSHLRQPVPLKSAFGALKTQADRVKNGHGWAALGRFRQIWAARRRQQDLGRVGGVHESSRFNVANDGGDRHLGRKIGLGASPPAAPELVRRACGL